MVNGTMTPYRNVGDELVRLRLLNASTARIYTFGFADDRGFSLVATDGGLLERPVTLDRLRLSPGERAEIVVRVRPGERTVLRSNDGPADPNTPYMYHCLLWHEDQEMMGQFVVVEPGGSAGAPPHHGH
jgi:FtsP/CotA-like multicopper oxidase with cupredoxin domain